MSSGQLVYRFDLAHRASDLCDEYDQCPDMCRGIKGCQGLGQTKDNELALSRGGMMGK